MIAQPGQDRDGDGTDAASSARHDHRAAIRTDAVPLQRDDRKHRRVAGRADGHGVVCAHAVG